MTSSQHLSLITASAALLLTCPLSFAQQPQEPPEESRAGLDYIGVLGTALEYRKVGEAANEDGEGWLSTGSIVLGSHISDLFHVELRAGTGLTGSEVTDDLTLEIDWFASWYMGIHYGLTSFSNIYAQVGFSHIQGSADLQNRDEPENNAYDEFDEDFPGSSFAFSWLAGIDLEVMDSTYVVIEAGRLFEDTDTSASGYQFNGGLRYEF